MKKLLILCLFPINVYAACASGGYVGGVFVAGHPLCAADLNTALSLKADLISPSLVTPILGVPQSGDFSSGSFTWPTFNQNTTGNAATATSAATLTTARAIYGNNFDGSAALTQIIASTYGGTGNGFTAFTGPTTSEKTFTLPDSNATLLYSGGDAGTPSALVLTNATGLPVGGVSATGTPSATTYLRGDGTWGTPSGAGTVTNTGGNLTANAVVLGAGVDDTKVVTGITTDGATKLNLGDSGSTAGGVVFSNATSGTLTLAPPTGALGTVTVTLPDATATLLYDGGALGTPASGTITNLSGTCTSCNIGGNAATATTATSATSATSATLASTATALATARAIYGNNFDGTAPLTSPVGPEFGGTGVTNNAASTITISGNYATTFTVSGTTGVTLPTTGTLSTLAGSETLSNKTLTTPTVNGYTECTDTPTITSGAVTVSNTTCTYHKLSLTENTTITLPTPVAGQSYTLQVCYDGTWTVTWAITSGNLSWSAASAPTATSTSGKCDFYMFTSHDTSYTYGFDGGRNFSGS